LGKTFIKLGILTQKKFYQASGARRLFPEMDQDGDKIDSSNDTVAGKYFEPSSIDGKGIFGEDFLEVSSGHLASRTLD